MENNIGNNICCAKRIQLYLYQATDCVMADGWCIAVNVFPWKYLWHNIFSFPFVNNGPVYPILKEIKQEALKPISLAFR